MALPMKTQLRYWGIGFVVFVLFMWLFGNVLAPFLLGMAIAYFLDPVADRLETMGFSRLWATVAITLFGLLSTIALMVALLPQLIEQAAALLKAAPEYIRVVWAWVVERFPALLDDNSSLRNGVDGVLEALQNQSGDIANLVLTKAVSLLDGLVFLIIAPVVSFYMLMDWDRMVSEFDKLLPRDHQEQIRDLAKQLDRTMAGFLRGQISVCAILGTFYAIALMLVGLQFGLIVGLLAGLLTFIPYVGSLVGGGLSIGLALFQFWGQPEMIIVVAGIFFIGQFVEGNILTPRLVGNSVGLHPVWLLFALSAFGSLLGFSGMLIAVPVAAAIGVFVRFGISRYQESPLYVGSKGKVATSDKPKRKRKAPVKKKA